MSVIFISDSRLCGVEGMRLGSSSSVVNKNQLIFISSQLDYDFCCHMTVQAFDPVAGLRLLPSYYTIHPLSGQLDYAVSSHMTVSRHDPGSWITSSAVIILYFTPIIRVAGLRLLQSYYTIHSLSGQLDYDFCSHMTVQRHYLCSCIMTSVVI